MKRLLTVLLAMAILMGLAVPTMASEEAPALELNRVFSVPFEKGIQAFTFTPTESGWYNFIFRSQDAIVYFSIFSEDGYCGYQEDWNIDENSYYYALSLTAGVTYTVEPGTSMEPADYTVEVTKPVLPQRMYFPEGDITTFVGETVWQDLCFFPEQAGLWKAEWSSSNPDVAEMVASDGIFLAKAPGTSVITATVAAMGMSISYTVTVKNIGTMVEGKAYTVFPTAKDAAQFRFTPETDGWYWFYSSGVSEDGIFGGIYPVNGNEISCDAAKEDTSNRNFYTAACLKAGETYYLSARVGSDAYNVYVVKASREVAGIVFDYAPFLSIPSRSWNIRPAFRPILADPGQLTITSSDPAVAYVETMDSGEYYLCTEAPGSAVITFTAENGVTGRLSVNVISHPVGDDLITLQSCGEFNNMLYELRDNGLATVFGEGKTQNWGSWEEYGNSVTEIALSEKTTAIESWFFEGATAVTGITIPASVEHIGFDAFGGSGIETICFSGSAPEMEEWALANINATVYYPDGDPSWDPVVGNDDYGLYINWQSYPANGTRSLKKVDGVWKYYIGDVHVPMSAMVQHYGSWYYVRSGVLASDFTGFVPHQGERYYVSSGKVLSGTTGFVEQGGVRYYIIRGKLVTSGLVYDNGEGYYVRWGNIAKDVTSLVKHNGEWYYVRQGKVDTGYSGTVDFNGSRYFVHKGKLANGLTKENGQWGYYVNGKLSTNTTALVDHYGGWYYVKNGKVATDVTGLVKYDGVWYYVKNGQVATKTTTLVKHGGEWFYVKNGKVDFMAEGLVKYNGGWYYIFCGKVAAKTTTLVKYGDNWYYIKAGTLDWSYNGTFRFYNGIYQIQNGRVVGS